MTLSLSSSKNNLSVILLIGCTGHVGRETLISLVKDARSSNFQIRVGVRNLERQAMLDPFGCEAVYLDLNKPESVEKACKSVSKIFLVLPNVPERIEHCKTVCNAAIQSKVEHIVLLSIIGSELKCCQFKKQFYECEQMFMNTGINWTILRSMYFQENLIQLGNQILKQNELKFLLNQEKIAPISVADIGEIATNILISNDPNPYFNRIYNLTGDELLSGQDIANILHKVSGADISYKFISKEEMLNSLVSSGLGEWESKGTVDLFDSFAHNESNYISKDSYDILHRAPHTLETTLNQHKDHFTIREPSSVKPLSPI